MAETTSTRTAVKKALMGATLIATSPAWGKPSGNTACNSGEGVSTGCKDQPGVNYLTLDEQPGRNVRLCASPDDADSKSGTSIMPNNMTVVVDPFKDGGFIEVIFTVSEVVAQEEPHIMFLVYSPKLSPTPQIPTKGSKHKLKLDMSALEILAVYNVPALSLMPNEGTRLGAANPAPTARISFKVNFDKDKLPRYMREVTNTVYLQAALIKADKYAAGQWDAMILSEVDKITFMAVSELSGNNKCPSEQASSIETDDDGTLTTVLEDSQGGTITKTSETREAFEVDVVRDNTTVKTVESSDGAVPMTKDGG